MMKRLLSTVVSVAWLACTPAVAPPSHPVSPPPAGTAVAPVPAPMAAARGVTSTDGARIHYLERRPASGGSPISILFAPGWMMPADIWLHQLDHFGAQRRVIAIDPRSQGESDKMADGNYPAMRARDLRAVIEQLGLEPAVLVGASSGVTDVAAYIDQFGTDGIRGFVLVHGVAGADYDPKSAPGLLAWAQRFQTDRRQQTEKLVRSMFVRPPPEAFVQELIRKALQMPTSHAIAAFFGSFTSDYRPALGKIDKPTLILTAKNAWLEKYEAMRQQIAGAEFEAWPDVGHAVYVDEAAKFNARVGEFIQRVEQGQR